MKKRKTLTIVIPVLNYEETLEDIVKRVERIADEIIVICDITEKDRENEIRKLMSGLQRKYKIKPIFRVNERGYGSAIRLGIRNASKDITIVMTGDNSDDIETIPNMMEEIENSDVVCGTRFSKGGGITGNMLKERVARSISIALRVFSKIKSLDVTNGFKAYRTSVAKKVQTEENSFAFTIEMLVKIAEKGYKINEVPTIWKNRITGKPNFQVKKEGKKYAFWTFYAILKMPSMITKTIFLFIVLIFLGIILI